MSLRWIEELINTRSIEFATDDLGTPDALGDWLRERELIPADVEVTPSDLRRAVRLREGLRALLVANNEPDSDATDAPDALDDLAALAQDLPLVLDVHADPPRLVPRATGPVDQALARVLAAVTESVAAGTWPRLKVCRQPNCRWAYYDHSRNRSRAWCDMSTCGNRAKARAYRQRNWPQPT